MLTKEWFFYGVMVFCGLGTIIIVALGDAYNRRRIYEDHILKLAKEARTFTEYERLVAEINRLFKPY